MLYPIIWRKVSFCSALLLVKRSGDRSSVLISAIFWEMKRAVSRLWPRMPVTRSVRVFSNMATLIKDQDAAMLRYNIIVITSGRSIFLLGRCLGLLHPTYLVPTVDRWYLQNYDLLTGQGTNQRVICME